MNVIAKLIRAGEFDLKQALLLWKFYATSRKNKAKARRKLGTNNVVNAMDRCYKRHLRYGFAALAHGVVLTKM